jgi:hypothetical protein
MHEDPAAGCQLGARHGLTYEAHDSFIWNTWSHIKGSSHTTTLGIVFPGFVERVGDPFNSFAGLGRQTREPTTLREE